MNHSRSVLFAVCLGLSLVLAGCCGELRSENMPHELQLAIDSFYQSVEDGNVEARIALFGDDALIMPNHWTAYEGKEDIAAMMRSSDGWVFKIRNREMVDFDLSGHIAYTVNAYEYAWYAEGTEPQWHKTKNVHVWKRYHDNQWKLHLDIWNSDVPIDQFTQE